MDSVDKTPNDLNIDNECLDSKNDPFFLIIYYPGSDPEYEYEILSNKDIKDTLVQEGESITVEYGAAKLHGIVVSVSDNLQYLQDNFDSLVEKHRTEVMEKKFIPKNKSGLIDCTAMESDVGTVMESDVGTVMESDVGTVMESGTQTEPMESSSCSVKYEELLRKYDDLKMEFNKFSSAIPDVTDQAKSRNNKLKRAILKRLNANNEYGEGCSSEITIGPEGTKVPKHIYESINWCSYTAATRKLLVTFFSRSILATHSLTGKPSPAFLTSNKQAKKRLNPLIISDIVQIVSKNCKVSESLVRHAVTTKCADENKLYKKKCQRM